MMEVVASGERAGGGQNPFQRRNVQEWSRLDELTGMLEHARVETDHWAASTSNTSHHFGKVVDSRSRNLADGGLEQRQQTKQLEVFQANIPGGSLQVIRSQSVTSTSSSWHGQHKISNSRWNSSSSEVPTPALQSAQNKEFDNLKLALNPLDLSSQKTKASVGRSGSIGSRRPPSRPRSIVSLKNEDISEEANRLSEISRITHQIHQEAKEKLFSNLETTSARRLLPNGLSKTKHDYDDYDTNDFPYSSEGRHNLRNSSIHEIAKSSSESTISSSHHSLTRKKSCSSEDLHHNEENNYPDDLGSEKPEWNRSSKVRRSLQYPSKPNAVHKEIPVVPLTKTVSQIKEEIEARKQIVSSVLKGNQWNNLGELEGVLGVVSNGHDIEPVLPTTPTKKRQSFITVESLKEVRGRLRKLSSPSDEMIRSEETDDGIVTEVKSDSPVQDKTEEILPRNSVKSYVFGMEAVLRNGKQPILGTGSLESRSSNKASGSGNSRTEEWYNRRKSYGFEQVNGQQNNNSSIEKSKVDSSTDSGICRSSETMTIPSWAKPITTDRMTTEDGNKLKTCHSIVIKRSEDENEQLSNKEKILKNEIESVIPAGRKTVVTLGTGNYSQSNWNWSSNKDELHNNNDVKKDSVTKGKIADALRKLREKSTSFESHRLSEPITISIPIQQPHPQITDPKLLLLKQTKEAVEQPETVSTSPLKGQNVTSYSHLLYGHSSNNSEKDISNEKIQENGDVASRPTSRTKTLSNWFDTELKRHSIAVDEAKYMTNRNKSYNSYYSQEGNDRKISLPTNNHARDGTVLLNSTTGHVFVNSNEKDANKYSGESDYEVNAHEKKQKKVEFCKTEVHFAAEPGRFNIVETDGKPPPSNMYRRRRKTTPSETTNRTGLPEIRFGDSQYEKNLLTSSENAEYESDTKVKPLTFLDSPIFQEENVLLTQSSANTSSCTYLSDSSQEEQKILEPQIYSEDETPRPRSILKNNIPKPKPFLLGENFNGEEKLWGVKLKSIHDTAADCSEVPLNNEDVTNTTKETEFQKLLRSLRPSHKPDFVRSPMETCSTAADNGLEVRISSAAALPDQRRASWSVADRIRHVEDLRTKGYSTKVNFGVGEAVVIDSEAEHSRISHYDSGESNSWFKKEQQSFSDAAVPTASNRVLTYAPHANHMSSVEAVVNNHPKVTSISLNYDNQPITIYNQIAQHASKTVNNTSDHEIIGNVEESENGARIWSFSKCNGSPVDRKSPSKIINENYILQKSERKIISPPPKKDLLDETDNVEMRPSHLLNRKTHSPSKDLLFVQEVEKQNLNLSETNRHRSLSPSNIRTQKKYNEDSAEKTSQTEPEYVNIKKDVKATQTSYRQTSSSQYNNKSARDKVKKDSKANEVTKNLSDPKRKERKLSTSSSGRDGWLNTPKEPQARHKSDISFRKVDVKKESHSNTNFTKTSFVKRNQHGSESPIYQNREVYANKRDIVDKSETESAILEELTKAADQILLAVNGYTDDDSFRGSSDDEYRKRHGREKIISKPLCTISETPNKKPTNTNYRRTSNITQRSRASEIHKDQRSTTKMRVGKTSSNSSMDSGPTEVRPLLTPEDRSKRRAARLLQRANSRELLLQTAASSSEDVGSGSEAGNVRTKQRIVRRTRTQGTRSSTSTQQTAVSHRSTTTASESRTRERVQRSTPIVNSDKASSKKQIVNKRTKVDEKLPNHLRPVSGSAGPVKCERAERRSLAMTSTNVLSKKKSYTSQSEDSVKSRE